MLYVLEREGQPQSEPEMRRDFFFTLETLLLFIYFAAPCIRWALLLSHMPQLFRLGQDLILDQTCSGPKPLSWVVLSFEIIRTQGVHTQGIKSHCGLCGPNLKSPSMLLQF